MSQLIQGQLHVLLTRFSEGLNKLVIVVVLLGTTIG